MTKPIHLSVNDPPPLHFPILVNDIWFKILDYICWINEEGVNVKGILSFSVTAHGAFQIKELFLQARLCTINRVQCTFKVQIDKYRKTYFSSPICFFKKIGDSYYCSDKTNHLVKFQPPKEIQADHLHEWDYTNNPINHNVYDVIDIGETIAVLSGGMRS